MDRPIKIAEAATLEELEQVRELFRNYQVQLPPRLRFPDSEWQDLPGPYAGPRGTLLLATTASRPSGCVGLRPFSAHGICEMKRLHVCPGFRGQGLGTLLVRRIIEVGRSLGYSSMRLDTHPPSMAAALALYRQFGFAEIPASPPSAIEDLMYMELPLR
jgi:carbonic anhydrase